MGEQRTDITRQCQQGSERVNREHISHDSQIGSEWVNREHISHDSVSKVPNG